jgi:hypothetical protein
METIIVKVFATGACPQSGHGRARSRLNRPSGLYLVRVIPDESPANAVLSVIKVLTSPCLGASPPVRNSKVLLTYAQFRGVGNSRGAHRRESFPVYNRANLLLFLHESRNTAVVPRQAPLTCPASAGLLLAAPATPGTLHMMTQMTDAGRKMLRDLVRTMVVENDRSEILLACMRDLLEHENADRALDLARAMAEVIRQQQEFVRLIQKLLEGTPVERAEMQAALEKERARRKP